MGQPKRKAVEGTPGAVVVQMPDRRPLTPKQERFAKLYVELGNASEAYRRSYDVSPDAKPEGVHVWASELLADRKITVRVEEIQAHALAESRLTGGLLISEGLAILETAKAEGDTRAAVAALTLLDKIHARLAPDTAGQDRRSVDELSDEELDAAVAKRRRPEQDQEYRARALELLHKLSCTMLSEAPESEFPILRRAAKTSEAGHG